MVIAVGEEIRNQMEAITSSQRRAWPRPTGPAEFADAQAAAEVDAAWLQYWMLFSRWWLPIFIITVVAAAATWWISAFNLQKWYRANAVLIPVATPLTPGPLGLLRGETGGGLAELFGTTSASESSAQEYMSILKSFAFTSSLADRHKPVAAFAIEANDGVRPRTQWQLYKIISGYFSCDYNIKTGGLSMSFMAKTRDDAQRILGFYVDDLRDKLRGRETHEAAVAVESLRGEINKTSDSLLQSQLYELMATQLQREKLAQVEADFAFAVIEPPVAADNPDWPHPTRNCVLVLLFAPMLMFGAIRALDKISQLSAEFRRRTMATGRGGSESGVSD